ncbi:hypothetical protein ACF0H5_013390 [Mactra antiquata]
MRNPSKLDCSGTEPSNMDMLICEIRQLMNNRQERNVRMVSKRSERRDQEERRIWNGCKECGLDKVSNSYHLDCLAQFCRCQHCNKTGHYPHLCFKKNRQTKSDRR